MLHEFLAARHDDLIESCRQKAAKRLHVSADTISAESAVASSFLRHLGDTLRLERSTSERVSAEHGQTPAPSEIGRAAALHGAEMLREGLTIDQVVHEYGDICQSVTELAVDAHVQISADQFRTLNRCLDDAIAGAVTSFSLARQAHVDAQAENLRTRFEGFADEYRWLVDVATEAFAAIRSGSVGVSGATGSLLVRILAELRGLADDTLPEIRSAATKQQPK
jgi:hypothetical protein